MIVAQGTKKGTLAGAFGFKNLAESNHQGKFQLCVVMVLVELAIKECNPETVTD